MKLRMPILAGYMIVGVSPGLAQEQPSDHTLEVSRALPAYMIQGEHYRIVDPVVNVFALDQFTIESDFGTFNAYGQLALRVRLREINAIAALREYDTSKTAKGALAREGKKSLAAVAEVGRHPIKSTKGIAKGIGRRFKKLGRNIKEDIATARSDKSKAEKAAEYSNRWLGVDSAKRRLASTLYIDPYSTNETLQAELTRVARVEAGAELGTKFVIPKIPGMEIFTDVHSIVTTYDLRELLEFNRKRLIELGATAEDVDYFLTMDVYSPTMTSLLISLIIELQNVDDVLALFYQALITDSSVDALFYVECVVMAAWYHHNRQPLKKMWLVTGLPAASTGDGEIVVFAATDFPHWTHEQESVIQELDRAYSPIDADPELLMAGNASGKFKAEVIDMGWGIQINLRNEYLPAFKWAITDSELQSKN